MAKRRLPHRKLVAVADLRAVVARLPQEIAEELVFAALTGLRREELTEVRADWLVRGVKGYFLLVPGDATKSGRPRDVGCPDLAREAFQRRAERYGTGPLFPRRDWRKRIANACKAAGVPRFTYRNLRTTFATIASASADLDSVRDAMGYSGVVTGR